MAVARSTDPMNRGGGLPSSSSDSDLLRRRQAAETQRHNHSRDERWWRFQRSKKPPQPQPQSQSQPTAAPPTTHLQTEARRRLQRQATPTTESTRGPVLPDAVAERVRNLPTGTSSLGRDDSHTVGRQKRILLHAIFKC